MLRIIPLSNSELRARLETSNDRDEGSPGVSVRHSDNFISIIAPIHLQYDIPGVTDAKGADRDPCWGCPERVTYRSKLRE